MESVELLILESFPVQVHALVQGNLADGCTEIDQIERHRDLENKAFEVTITTSRDPDKMCTQALVPFEETVPLDVRDLPAGTYSVDVNGVQGSFELQMDNSLYSRQVWKSRKIAAASRQQSFRIFPIPTIHVLCTANDLVLQPAVQLAKIGAVPGHAHHQMAICLGPRLRLAQRLGRDDVKLHVGDLQRAKAAQQRDKTLRAPPPPRKRQARISC